MKSVILFLLLASTAQAQNITIAGPFSGLNNSDPSITIDVSEAQATLNVEVAQDAMSLKKRKGYILGSTLDVATGPVTGAIYFKSTLGDNIKVFAHDRMVSASVNGAAYVNIITSAPIGTRWSFCASAGKIFAFNDSSSIPWSYNGTDVTYHPAMPKASLCAMTVDRMLLAGVAAEPNRLYFSRSGDVTDFVVDIEPEDPGFEDIGLAGEKITAIFATQSEWLVFKTNSFTSYQGTNQFDLMPSVISEKVGMIESHAIVQHEGIVYFKSTEGKFWAYNSGTITELSKKISGIVDNITRDDIASTVFTDKAHFDTGTYSATSGSSTAGSVEPLPFSFTDTTSADFNAGTVDPALLVDNDAIYIRSLGATPNLGTYFPNIGAESTDFTNWSNTGWENLASYSGYLPDYGDRFFKTSSYSGANLYFYIKKLSTNEIVYTATTYLSGSSYRPEVDVNADITALEDTDYYIRVQFGTSLMTSASFKRGIVTGKIHKFSSTGGYFDLVETPPFASSGTYISQIHTTLAPPPHYGAFLETSSVTAGSSISYTVASATSPTGVFGAWGATTALSTTDTAYKIKAEISVTSNAITSPYINDIGLTFRSTGYWETPEVSMGGMDTWGTFSANSATTGGGSMTYQIYVSTYAGGTANANPESLTSGVVPTVSTGTYSKIRVINSFSAYTDTARLNDISWRWNIVTDKLANAFEYNGDIYFSVPYGFATFNNRLLKLDTKLGGWNVFDIQANVPIISDGKVYFGSPSSSNIFEYPEGDSDNGAAINSYWKSKNYIGSNPYVEKKFQKLSVIAGSNYGSNLDVTYTKDTAGSTSYTISLTSTAAEFMRNNRVLPTGEIGTFFNLQIGNNAANQPWTFFGASIDYKDDPWRVTGD